MPSLGTGMCSRLVSPRLRASHRPLASGTPGLTEPRARAREKKGAARLRLRLGPVGGGGRGEGVSK
eukprot:5685407-Pyramimonas_sp.AAC.1